MTDLMGVTRVMCEGLLPAALSTSRQHRLSVRRECVYVNGRQTERVRESEHAVRPQKQASVRNLNLQESAVLSHRRTLVYEMDVKILWEKTTTACSLKRKVSTLATIGITMNDPHIPLTSC